MFDKLQIEEVEIDRGDAQAEGEALMSLNFREADEISDEDLEAAAAFWDREVAQGRPMPIFPANR